MLMDLIATFAVGAGFTGFVVIARHLSKGRVPKWALPAAFGLGMLLFSMWNEYTWFGRTTAALPGEVVILSTPTDRAAFRPWTYLVPVSTRFAALDRTGMLKSTEDSTIRRAEVMLVQRWTPTRRVPLAFDCAKGRRADLVDGAELLPDGTLTGGTWMDADDEIQRAACQGG